MRTTEAAISAVVASVSVFSSQTCALSFHLTSARSQSVLVTGCPAACAVSGREVGSTTSIDPAQTLAFSSDTNLASSRSDRVKGWYAYAPLAKAAPIKLLISLLIPCSLSARISPAFKYEALYQRTDRRDGSL